MLRFFIVLIFTISSFQVHAGWKSKVVIAGFTEHYISRTMLTAVLEGKNIERAISIAKQVSKSSIGRKYLYNLLSENLITEPHGFAASNASTIITGANLGTNDFTKKLNYEMTNYHAHRIAFATLSKEMKKEKKYYCINKLQIYDENAYIPFNYYTNPVKEWQFGAHKELVSGQKRNDHLEHDHIPSIAAVLLYLQRRDGGKLLKRDDRSYGQIVHDNATALEVTDVNHRAGRTYFNKNTVSQINNDSMDLLQATIDDLSYHFKNSKKISAEMKQAFVDIYARNAYLCLYR